MAREAPKCRCTCDIPCSMLGVLLQDANAFPALKFNPPVIFIICTISMYAGFLSKPVSVLVLLDANVCGGRHHMVRVVLSQCWSNRASSIFISAHEVVIGGRTSERTRITSHVCAARRSLPLP